MCVVVTNTVPSINQTSPPNSTNHSTFEDWTRRRVVVSLGTNAGAEQLPFQGWRHFKEAFAPELVARAIAQSNLPVKRCVDPFGGSGTTSLACQFLGVHPVTIEVNPFLADLIEAKLATYDANELAKDLGSIVRWASRKNTKSESALDRLPATFVEPGVHGRWLFERTVAARVADLLAAIENLAVQDHRRLFRVLLGGILVDLSNVVVNGKGRRYRRGWQNRRRDATEVEGLFCDSARRAISEIHRFADRASLTYEIHRGDCRVALEEIAPCDLAVFSPPYPNSFDYTDVYNIELWMLGYLQDRQMNHALRGSTLCSHVQISRNFPAAPVGSQKLTRSLDCLSDRRDDLWNYRITEMVGAYFSDMVDVIRQLYRRISPGGSLWMVVGDSRYADVQIETAKILAELTPQTGWRVDNLEPFRSMRASAQQGGRLELAETLMVLSRG